MRKELIGIGFLFLMLFIAASLFSYSPLDPSINNTETAISIHNVFGLVGAHIAGFLIFLFGLGSFWIPVLFFLLALQIIRDQHRIRLLISLAGGLGLILSTGSILSLWQAHYYIFGERFSSGGIIGIPFKSALVSYLKPGGAAVVLTTLWIIALIMATGLSIVRLFQESTDLVKRTYRHASARLSLWKARREKMKKGIIAGDSGRKEAQDRPLRIKNRVSKSAPPVPVPEQQAFEFMGDERVFRLPSPRFLDDPDQRLSTVDRESLEMQSRLVEKKLEDFGVRGRVVEISPGPVITTFEYEPAAGIKINKVVNLSDDLAMALRAASIRIVAPIPGKAAIGIEIPNAERELVRFKEMVASDGFVKSKSKLTICLGKDIVGNPTMADLVKMPHLLIAGATGSGKSVALNAMICSILFKATPKEVKLLMIDPKRIELAAYDGIPHLIAPVVTDVKKATNALFWAVQEMERRYQTLAEVGARNMQQYNQKVVKEADQLEDCETLPYVVIVIDELADMMMVASRDVEFSLTRLAQMARAAGIHLILATQRPSVDVLTGIIKANFPTRITFQVSSRTDSRTIIDTNGAEDLLGNGDMLFFPPGAAKLQRIHGAFISETELGKVLAFLKAQQTPDYDTAITETRGIDEDDKEEIAHDEKYDEAVALVAETRQASISMIQRRLRIGYNRAARIIEVMEKEGVVGPSDGVRPREVLVRGYQDRS